MEEFRASDNNITNQNVNSKMTYQNSKIGIKEALRATD